MRTQIYETHSDAGHFVASFVLVFILFPIFIILLSTFLTGDMFLRKMASLVIFIYAPLTLSFIVLGAWMDRG